MDINTLKSFVAVSESLNISQAAKRLHLTQPAVSIQIKQLEAYVGSALFDRSPLRLTSEGGRFLVKAREIIELWSEAITTAQSEQSLTSGSLTISLSDPVMRYLLMDKIEHYAKQYPGVRLSFLNRTSIGTLDAVANSEADIGIALFDKPHKKLHHRLLANYREVAVVADNHELAKDGVVDLRRLSKYRLLLLEKRALSRKWADALFRQQEITLNDVVSLGSVDAQLELARINQGVAIVPAFTVLEGLKTKSSVSERNKTLSPVSEGIKVLKITGWPERQLATYYKRLKPTSKAWLELGI